MVTDIFKTIYLSVFKIVFTLFNLVPIQKKLVMFVTFRQNAFYITKELSRRPDNIKIVLICNKASYKRLSKIKDDRITMISLDSKYEFLTRVYHLATSKVVIVDNYFPFLAVTNFKRNVECIQIWHAAGAIKSFGLEAKNTVTRTKVSIKRFHNVYDRFDKILVGSDEMAEIFKKAFGLTKDVFLKTGIPRTDLFFNAKEKDEIINSFFHAYPQAAGKKIILYAPTFRDKKNHKSDMDFEALKKHLGDDYFFVIKYHPVTNSEIKLSKAIQKSFLFIHSGYDVNELLQVTDLLITDYSSIPYEFCLLNRPMIFYAYDLEEYMKERGVWETYENIVPGPVVHDVEGLIDAIKNTEVESVSIQNKQFCEVWNKYSNGQSSKHFVNYILKKL